ncbi:protein of unknown function (plasmid) [Azospirillum baldaniorum]|uniref:Uncharacterized protein n=1 Tax=Azospirillum baldaniorum TaxID=1064539 RepID=A0A9P1JXV8_9PROT|nr:protein of unknown function [Azospirillum baldaniorum]
MSGRAAGPLRRRASTLLRTVPDRGRMHAQQLRPRRALAHGTSQLERPPMAVRAARGLTPAPVASRIEHTSLNVPLTCGAPTPDLREGFSGPCGPFRFIRCTNSFANSQRLGIG